MNIENEIRFFDESAKKIIDIIHSNSRYKKIYDRFLMKRSIFDLSDDNSWIRVRKEQNKTTLTLKKVLNSTSIDGVQEFEIIVHDYQKTNQLLEALGYKKRSEQENFREAWETNGVEITIDTWPGIEPIVEIEAKEKEQIYSVLNELTVKEEEGTLENITQLYLKRLGIDIKHIPQLTFETISNYEK